MPSEVVGFWTRETISNVRRNRLMSLLAVTTVTTGLFVLGVFYLIWGSVQSKVAQQADQLELGVILNREITPKRRKEIFEAARMPQVAEVKVFSKERALERYTTGIREFPIEDFKNSNPFGDELQLKLKNPEDYFKVRSYMLSIKGVEDVRRGSFDAVVDDKTIKNLLAVNNFVQIAGFVSFLVLGFGILLIIYNTIRLTIFARRREIRIMELVGATPAFIRVPFLMEGLIYGITGAVYASIVLLVLFGSLMRADTPLIRLLLPASPGVLLWKCLLWTVGAGLMFGVVGSWLSLSRSLGRSTHRD